MLTFPVVINTGLGDAPTWWNCSILENLFKNLPEGLLEKHRYAKFVGLGKQREWAKDGKSGVSNDILITGVEMQNGEYIRADMDNEPGSEG